MIGFHLSEILGISTFIEIGSRIEGSKRRNEEFSLNDYRVSVRRDEIVLKIDSGSGWTIF